MGVYAKCIYNIRLLLFANYEAPKKSFPVMIRENLHFRRSGGIFARNSIVESWFSPCVFAGQTQETIYLMLYN